MPTGIPDTVDQRFKDLQTHIMILQQDITDLLDSSIVTHNELMNIVSWVEEMDQTVDELSILINSKPQ